MSDARVRRGERGQGGPVLPAPSGDGIVDIWHIRLAPNRSLNAGYLRVLSLAERARYASYTAPGPQLRFLVTRGATRLVLASYLGVPATSLVLTAGPEGKPELVGHTLQFSLSHSAGLALLAVTSGRGVGVDVERVRPVGLGRRLAARYFTVAENALLTGTDADVEFARLWTRKEACVKAAGGRLAQGLGLPVAGGRPTGSLLVIDLSRRLPGSWLVHDIDLPPGQAGAVALAGAKPFQIRHHRWDAHCWTSCPRTTPASRAGHVVSRRASRTTWDTSVPSAGRDSDGVRPGHREDLT